MPIKPAANLKSLSHTLPRDPRARIIWHGDGLPMCCAGRSAICSSAPIQPISGFIRQALPCH
jgi:hypothetical protein